MVSDEALGNVPKTCSLGILNGHIYSCLPLDKTKFTVRLLTLLPGSGERPIRCRLRTVIVNAAASYEALSYTWGSKEATDLVQVNKMPFQVTPNLRNALAALRKPDQKRELWIDAICINQDDMHERQQQVSEMGHIFRNASRVIIWLGTGNTSTDLIMTTMRSLLWPSDHDLGLHCAAGLQDILLRKWFTRVWVVQELSMGVSDPLLICGASSISWSAFIHFIAVWGSLVLEALGPTPQDASQSGQLSRAWHQLFHALQMDDMRNRVQKPPRLRSFTAVNDDYTLLEDDLLHWLKRTAIFEATDARDRLYALLGLTRSLLWGQIRIDYSVSTDQIMRALTVRQIQAHKSLDLLTLCNPGRSSRFASWIPDMTVSGLSELPPTLYPLEELPNDRGVASHHWIDDLPRYDSSTSVLSPDIEDFLSRHSDKRLWNSLFEDLTTTTLGVSQLEVCGNIRTTSAFLVEVASSLPGARGSFASTCDGEQSLELRGLRLGQVVCSRSDPVHNPLQNAWHASLLSICDTTKYVFGSAGRAFRACQRIASGDVSDMTIWELSAIARSLTPVKIRLAESIGRAQVRDYHDEKLEDGTWHTDEAFDRTRVATEEQLELIERCEQFCHLGQRLVKAFLEWMPLWTRLPGIDKSCPTECGVQQRSMIGYARYFPARDVMALNYGVSNRQTFTTDTGLLGLGPPDLRDRDVVVMLGTCTTAFALRPTPQPGVWTLVGPVVVCPPYPVRHDADRGPPLTEYPQNWKPLKQETFVLR